MLEFDCALDAVALARHKTKRSQETVHRKRLLKLRGVPDIALAILLFQSGPFPFGIVGLDSGRIGLHHASSDLFGCIFHGQNIRENPKRVKVFFNFS